MKCMDDCGGLDEGIEGGGLDWMGRSTYLYLTIYWFWLAVEITASTFLECVNKTAYCCVIAGRSFKTVTKDWHRSCHKVNYTHFVNVPRRTPLSLP